MFDVDKFVDFNGEIISLNPSKSGGDIVRKLLAWAGQGQAKTTVSRNQLLRHSYRELILVVNRALCLSVGLVRLSPTSGISRKQRGLGRPNWHRDSSRRT